MVSYAPEEAKLIESGALTTKQNDIECQGVGCRYFSLTSKSCNDVLPSNFLSFSNRAGIV